MLPHRTNGHDPSLATRREADVEPERAWVLHPVMNNGRHAARAPQDRLDEAIGLARAIDLDIANSDLVPIRKARPGTLFGTGRIEQLKDEIVADRIDLVIVDQALTPVQQRNLETALNCKVIDRTGLILEIFGRRARTREGRLQVELASLTYQRSRLVRSWTHLERQRGGFGFMGGPGESQLEADRRIIDQRVTRIRRALSAVVRTRELHRGARRKVPYPVVGLVGYTNAGKSTLFNRLTGAGVVAEDQLFATLDPTMRGLTLPSGRSIILSDTVGFISDLPTDLVAAFRATLEEVLEADVLVHVRDIAHPDAEAQKTDVEDVLAALGTDAQTPVLEALNKADLLSSEQRSVMEAQAERCPNAVLVSAKTGEGSDALLEALDEILSGQQSIVELDVALDDGAALAWLYAHGCVIDRADNDQSAHVTVGLDPADLARFQSRFHHIRADSHF